MRATLTGHFEVDAYTVNNKDFAAAGMGLFHFESVADFDIHGSPPVVLSGFGTVVAYAMPELLVYYSLAEYAFGGVFLAD